MSDTSRAATLEPTTIEFTADEHPRSRNLALDGVRAFAVIAVLTFHGGLAHFHGGFLGVDVFFALSGFLITSLLISEYDTRRSIRLSRFYLRRAKRLLPALLLVILAVSVGAWLLTPPGLYPDLHIDVLAAFFYVSNWHLIGQQSNYFTILFPPSQLTHTWSLAIEEQFYIVWPLIILLVFRVRRRVTLLGALAAVGAVASTALMAYGFHHTWTVDRLYYGTDTHAEGLLLGAATACLLYVTHTGSRLEPKGAPGVLKYLHYAGPVAMIALLAIMERAYGTSKWMYNGGFLAVAVASCVSIAYLVAHPHTPIARGLSWRPLVYVGQISYGIYLWHYPIFHWLTGYATGLSVWPLFAARCAASFLAAVLSFHLVEMPIRRGAWPSSRRGALGAVAVMSLLLATSLVVANAANVEPVPVPPASANVSDPVRVMLLGDSEMWTLGYELTHWGPHYGLAIGSQAIIGCGLVPSTVGRINQYIILREGYCLLHKNGYFRARPVWRIAITKSHANVVVVLAGRWETTDLLIRGHWLNIYDASFRQRITRSIGFIAADAAAQHAKLVLMTAPCAWSGEQVDGAQYPENSPQRLAIYNNLIRADAKKFHASVFNLYSLVCPTNQVQYYLHGYLVRDADGVHFANDSAPFIAPALLPYLRRLGLAARATATSK